MAFYFGQGITAEDPGAQFASAYKQSRLGSLLANQNPGERQSRLADLYKVDPQYGMAAQAHFDKMDERTAKQLQDISRMTYGAWQSGNKEAAQSLYGQAVQLAKQVYPGFQVADQLDDATAQMLGQFASAGGGASGVQSTYVDRDGNRVAIMRDGSTRSLGQNDLGMSQQTITVEGPNGEPMQYTFDKRTGNYRPMGQSAPQGGIVDFQGIPMREVRGPDGNVYRVQADSPEASQAFSAEMGAGMPVSSVEFPERVAQSSRPWTANTPNPYGDATPRPGVGMSAAEKAFAQEQAKQRAQLSVLPEQEQVKTQAAIEQARGVEQAKAGVERDAQAPKRREKFRLVQTGIQNTMNAIDGVIDKVNWVTAGPIGAAMKGIPGTPAYALAKAALTVKANIGFDRLQQMRDASPTGGALGQVAVQELDALQASIASLDQGLPPEDLEANLKTVRQHYQNWLNAVRQAEAADTGVQQQGVDQRRKALLDKY